MTNQAQPSHEKSWLQSKKFVAFLVTQLGLFTLLGAMVCTEEVSSVGDNLSFMLLIVTIGFLATGYCLGQSYVDRYIRVAMIMTGHNPPTTPVSELTEEEN